MNLKNIPPLFVPEAYRASIEKFSKAALMDMLWNIAGMTVESTEDDAQVGLVIFKEAHIVYRARNQKVPR